MAIAATNPIHFVLFITMTPAYDINRLDRASLALFRLRIPLIQTGSGVVFARAMEGCAQGHVFFSVPTAPQQSIRPAVVLESAQRRTVARDRARIEGGRCVRDNVASGGRRRGRAAT